MVDDIDCAKLRIFPDIANYFRTYYYFSGAEIINGGAEKYFSAAEIMFNGAEIC